MGDDESSLMKVSVSLDAPIAQLVLFFFHFSPSSTPTSLIKYFEGEEIPIVRKEDHCPDRVRTVTVLLLHSDPPSLWTSFLDSFLKAREIPGTL